MENFPYYVNCKFVCRVCFPFMLGVIYQFETIYAFTTCVDETLCHILYFQTNDYDYDMSHV